MDFICIENDPRSARIYEEAGVARIMVDLEILGKRDRQGHLDTTISGHTMVDVSRIRNAIQRAKLLVRLNPWYGDSHKEVNEAIIRGADILMLPMFTGIEEVCRFFDSVDGRVDTILLLETAKAVNCVLDILSLSKGSELYVGLNDLSLSLGHSFLFQPLADGMMDELSDAFRSAGTRFGFGGIGTIETGLVKGADLMWIHAALGSDLLILSRTFKQACQGNYDIIHQEVEKLRLEHVKAMNASVEERRGRSVAVKEMIMEISLARSRSTS